LEGTGGAQARSAEHRRGEAAKPFGETWVSEHKNTEKLPYLFTSKELDEDTGLYYFGARYYDPRTSVWRHPIRR
jgi:hypothetical protein